MSQRHCMIIPADMADLCNQIAVQLGTDAGGKLNTFGTPGYEDAQGNLYCVADGVLSPDPAIWEARRQALEAGFSNGQLAGAKWWRWHDSGPLKGQLVASWDGLHLEEMWSKKKCLAAAGLQERVEEELYPPEPA